MFLNEAFIAKLKYNEKLDHYRKLRNFIFLFYLDIINKLLDWDDGVSLTQCWTQV